MGLWPINMYQFHIDLLLKIVSKICRIAFHLPLRSLSGTPAMHDLLSRNIATLPR